MELGEPDASGRRSPKPIRGSEFLEPCDFVISAIGQSTTVADLLDGKVPDFLPPGEALNLTRWQTVQVNEKTFETTVEGVFSGGDVVTGRGHRDRGDRRRPQGGVRHRHATSGTGVGAAGARGVHQPQGRVRQGRR